MRPKAETTRQDLDVVYALEVAVVLSLAPTPYSPRYFRIGAKWEDMRATTATLNLADLEAVAALTVSNPPTVCAQSTFSLAMLPTAARSALALTVKKRLHSREAGEMRDHEHPSLDHNWNSGRLLTVVVQVKTNSTPAPSQDVLAQHLAELTRFLTIDAA